MTSSVTELALQVPSLIPNLSFATGFLTTSVLDSRFKCFVLNNSTIPITLPYSQVINFLIYSHYSHLFTCLKYSDF
jgi:hypothetical protein